MTATEKQLNLETKRKTESKRLGIDTSGSSDYCGYCPNQTLYTTTDNPSTQKWNCSATPKDRNSQSLCAVAYEKMAKAEMLSTTKFRLPDFLDLWHDSVEQNNSVLIYIGDYEKPKIHGQIVTYTPNKLYIKGNKGDIETHEIGELFVVSFKYGKCGLKITATKNNL